MSESQNEVKPNAFADKVSTVATGVAVVATFAAAIIVFPVGGAIGLGVVAAHAGAGFLGTTAAVVGGFLAGCIPYNIVDAATRKKDPATGAIEALCKPGVFVGEAVNCLLSPRYGLSKLKSAFSHASQKPADVTTLPAPAPEAPAAKVDAPKQG
jgi:hypothetical protein